VCVFVFVCVCVCVCTRACQHACCRYTCPQTSSVRAYRAHIRAPPPRAACVSSPPQHTSTAPHTQTATALTGNDAHPGALPAAAVRVEVQRLLLRARPPHRRGRPRHGGSGRQHQQLAPGHVYGPRRTLVVLLWPRTRGGGLAVSCR